MPTEFFGGQMLIEEFPGVMMPSQYSQFLASCLTNESQRQALDVGCGSGYLAIRLAQLGVPSVVAIDNDSKAVAATRYNVALNQVADVVEVREGDLLEGFDEVEYVVCNPPTFPEFSGVSQPCIGGPTGYEFILALLNALKDRLVPEGVLMCVLSSVFDIPRIVQHAKDRNMTCEILQRKRIAVSHRVERLLAQRGIRGENIPDGEELNCMRFRKLPTKKSNR